MEYRHLPHGDERERFSVLGLGMGGIQGSGEDEIEAVVRRAVENGINFFDLCAGGKSVYVPFGRAIAGARDRVFFQMHLGAVYSKNGEYAWSRSLAAIKKTIEWELAALGTDYADMGYLHCVDEYDDYEKLVSNGVLKYLEELKASGAVHHIGFSSHTPSLANMVLDTGLVDMMMFSDNAAYDFEKGDAYGSGSVPERAELFRRCEKEGVGVSVMKPFLGGKLLDGGSSPFGRAMTRYQCIQYALDRPAVLTVVPGVRGMADLEELLGFVSSSAEERDYSFVGDLAPEAAEGSCVYCNHCQPCPAGLDVGLINKYYDLAVAGDAMAASHYGKLSVKADACISCGHCDSRCPFHVAQSARMKEIAAYFPGK